MLALFPWTEAKGGAAGWGSAVRPNSLVWGLTCLCGPEAILPGLEQAVPRRRPRVGPLLERARKKSGLPEGPGDSVGGPTKIWQHA